MTASPHPPRPLLAPTLANSGFPVLFACTTPRPEATIRPPGTEPRRGNRETRQVSPPTLDDLSYVQKNQAETSVLFELIAARYERRSMLITANQPFGTWDFSLPRQGHDRRRHRQTRPPRSHLRTGCRKLSSKSRRRPILGCTPAKAAPGPASNRRPASITLNPCRSAASTPSSISTAALIIVVANRSSQLSCNRGATIHSVSRRSIILRIAGAFNGVILGSAPAASSAMRMAARESDGGRAPPSSIFIRIRSVASATWPAPRR